MVHIARGPRIKDDNLLKIYKAIWECQKELNKLKQKHDQYRSMYKQPSDDTGDRETNEIRKVEKVMIKKVEDVLKKIKKEHSRPLGYIKPEDRA